MFILLQLCWLRILTPVRYLQGLLRSGYQVVNPAFTQMGWSNKVGKIVFSGMVLFIAYSVLSMGLDLIIHSFDKTHPSTLLSIVKSLGSPLSINNPWIVGFTALFGVLLCLYFSRLYVRFFRFSLNQHPDSFHDVLISHQEHIESLKEKRRLQASLPPARGKSKTPRL